MVARHTQAPSPAKGGDCYREYSLASSVRQSAYIVLFTHVARASVTE